MFSSLKDTRLQVFVYKWTNPAKWKQTEEKKEWRTRKQTEIGIPPVFTEVKVSQAELKMYFSEKEETPPMMRTSLNVWLTWQIELLVQTHRWTDKLKVKSHTLAADFHAALACHFLMKVTFLDLFLSLINPYVCIIHVLGEQTEEFTYGVPQELISAKISKTLAQKMLIKKRLRCIISTTQNQKIETWNPRNRMKFMGNPTEWI